MTTRSKQHGLKVTVQAADEVDNVDGHLSSTDVDRFFVLQVSKYEEKSRCIKRFRDLSYFRTSLGELADRVSREWPDLEEQPEMRTEEMATIINEW